MPNDNIERAIKRASGEANAENYEEMRYEGYGPGGVAIIVETLTDNRNRTAADVRAAFAKAGGSLGETGSVSFMFDRVGQVIYPAAGVDADALFEAALESGADNMESDAQLHEITCAMEDFNELREALEAKFGAPQEAGIVWKPQNTVPVETEDLANSLFKLVDTLEDHDDVQKVSANFDIPEAIMEKLGG